mmetsp:Transcript_27861/g.55831  ORF Transcript_27861/g.55831 Transcript_27861/m.55831 type:complete len:285 (+) Transcript_27861:94-948(+)|eukprot:CAMPEP_0194305990 /NCGR_PEP_ID=MMETSP0171-20130528/3282_1 /TAXON_ID=218684 /ORGANISM="Corethron pennatum, Strain L29A3" /LENGTH=284 /DNA_ID=CAMNT_0039057665 /DNA_START=56 /DNA_END=910 /DNA_ORIENTATION=+
MAMILIILANLCFARGFIPSQGGQLEYPTTRTKNLNLNNALQAIPVDAILLDAQEIESARFAFGMCFFGATGAASIGRETIPIRYKRYMFRQSLKGQGPTTGGEALDILALAGYPEEIKIGDVQKVINNKLSAFDIVKKYPIEKKTYKYTHTGRTTNEFLYYEAFAQANKDSNPLAVRAVFDSFTNGGNTVYAGTAQENMDVYKDDITQLAKTLNKTKLLGLFAFVFLIGLVGAADYFAAYHLYHGWFPSWPGGQNFPACLFDKETGPFTIPEYWISDVPGKES